MKVSVVIPCFNERHTIEQIVDAVRKAPLAEREIILVDDGSNDGTTAVLNQSIAPLVDRIIDLPNNQGKGAALRAGFVAATGEVILVQDADLEFEG
jgi:glycosyltransferase involved in cell wall biosynthesis